MGANNSRTRRARRCEIVQKQPEPISSRSARRWRVRQRGARSAQPVHEVCSSGEKNGRREGPIQRRRNATQHKSVSNEPHSAANVARHRSSYSKSNGRHERPLQHDATISKRRPRQNVRQHGTTLKKTIFCFNFILICHVPYFICYIIDIYLYILLEKAKRKHTINDNAYIKLNRIIKTQQLKINQTI